MRLFLFSCVCSSTRLAIHLQVHGRGRATAVVHEASDLRGPEELARLALLEAVHVVGAHALVCDQHLRVGTQDGQGRAREKNQAGVVR